MQHRPRSAANAYYAMIWKAAASIYLFKTDVSHPLDHMCVHSGQISFHTKNSVTPYHGRFTDEIDRLVLQFHWQGDLNKTKTAVLFPGGLDDGYRRRYRGYDCMGNFVELTTLTRTQWCNRCKGWHTVDRGEERLALTCD